MVFGFGKKKKAEEAAEDVEEAGFPEEEFGERVLPSELEKFKLKGPFEEALESAPAPPRHVGRERSEQPALRKEAESDLTLVLDKLDVIDARLRVIEEKLKRL
jgi:hypothetical protein